MLVGILASVLLYNREQDQQVDNYQSVHQALSKLHEQAMLQGALYQSRTGRADFPRNISPTWFAEEPLAPNNGEFAVPINVMVPTEQPWLDVAPAGDLSDNPPDPIITNQRQAGFWYNPNRGLFRARVMQQNTDKLSLEIYNELNGTELRDVPLRTSPGHRPQAVPLTPGALVSNEPDPAPIN